MRLPPRILSHYRFWLISVQLPIACALAPMASAQVHYYPAKGAAPFSRAVQIDNVLHLSGMIGTRPDGSLPPSMPEQAQAVMTTIERDLKSFDLSMDDVVECTVFLADMQQWQAFNSVYVSFFKAGRLPARSALGANGLALGALVEVQCNAYRPSAKVSP